MNYMNCNKQIHVLIPMALFLLFSVLYTGTYVMASTEPSGEYVEAVKLYNNGEYVKSAEEFSRLAAMGIRNGDLFYNTGNAYFKAGDIGRCLVWYERALKLIPKDPDLKFNYDYVCGLIKDKAEEKSLSVFRIVFFWKYMLTEKTIQWAGILLFSLFALLVLVQMKRPSNGIKYTSRIVGMLSLIFILTAYYNYFDVSNNQKAIIISSSTPVRSGLTDDSTELFVLHQGTKVKVDEEMKGYIKIRFSDDKIGWVKKDCLELI